MALIFVIVIAIPLIFYVVWANYFSPQAQQENNSNVEQYQAATQTYEAAMRADTYGGKTPEETLTMFIDALKKGNINLASKYFLLEQNTQNPNYLTRKKWEDALALAKSENKLSSVIVQLQNVKKAAQSNESASFETLDNNGVVNVLVEFKLNTFSSVWKIESL